MTTTRWTVRVTALLCAGAFLTACGGSADQEGTAPPAGSDHAAGEHADAPEVDPAALDTGEYRTTPMEPFGVATPEQMSEIEGQRLAEFVLVPFEIDPALTEASGTPSVAKHAGQLVYSFSESVHAAIEKNGILTAFVSGARTPTADYTEIPRDFLHAVIRTEGPDQAQRLAADMHAAALAGGEGRLDTPHSPWVPLDSRLKDSLTTQDTVDGPHGPIANRQVFTAHGDYVIYDWSSAPEADAAWADRIVADALEKQKPLTDAFPATPTKVQRGEAEPEYTQIDQDEILVYALPRGEDEEFVAEYMAVYGPRGMAHNSTNPPADHALLSEVGAEHNAVGGNSTVYRAKDDAGAQRIVDEFVAGMVNGGYTEAPSPEGLPTTPCYTQHSERGESISCLVLDGRYVGEISGDDEKDVHQRTSAQYLILTHADQDA